MFYYATDDLWRTQSELDSIHQGRCGRWCDGRYSAWGGFSGIFEAESVGVLSGSHGLYLGLTLLVARLMYSGCPLPDSVDVRAYIFANCPYRTVCAMFGPMRGLVGTHPLLCRELICP